MLKATNEDDKSDLGIECVPILGDNTRTLNIKKNIVQHKRTKHINIRYHFLRYNVEKYHIINFCTIEKQIDDNFTKELESEQFERNRLQLG